MPRGNDPTALADLRGQYAEGGNAEQMIQASRFAYSPKLRTAQMLPYLEEETDALHEKGISSLHSGEGEVLDAAVHGDKSVKYVVVVVETPSGRTVKDVIDGEDAGLGKPRSKHSVAPSLSEEEEAERSNLEASLQRQAAVAEAKAEADKKVAEAQKKADEETAKAAEKADKGAAKSSK